MVKQMKEKALDPPETYRVSPPLTWDSSRLFFVPYNHQNWLMCLSAVQKFGKIYLGLKYKTFIFMQLDIRMKTITQQLFAQKKTKQNQNTHWVCRDLHFFFHSLYQWLPRTCDLGPRITYNGALIRGHRHQTPPT